MLDREECAIRIPKHMDKGRKDRVQYIPAALLARLVVFVDAVEDEKTYARPTATIAKVRQEEAAEVFEAMRTIPANRFTQVSHKPRMFSTSTKSATLDDVEGCSDKNIGAEERT